MTDRWIPLQEDGKLRDGLLWMDRRRWPGVRTLWLWLRQGMPKDFPVIVGEGTITATARDVEPDGTPVINAEDVKIRDWDFSHSLLPMGSIHTHVLIRGLLERRNTQVTFPDGSVRTVWVRFRPESDEQT